MGSQNSWNLDRIYSCGALSKVLERIGRKMRRKYGFDL